MDNKPRVNDKDVIPKLDVEKGELRAPTGEDWVLISGEALRRIYEHEVMILGTGAFVIWYNAGKAVGKTEGEKFAGMVNSMGVDQLAQELSKAHAQLGWGRIEVRGVDVMRNEIISDSQFADGPGRLRQRGQVLVCERIHGGDCLGDSGSRDDCLRGRVRGHES